MNILKMVGNTNFKIVGLNRFEMKFENEIQKGKINKS